jgi:hypothetical protein
MPGGPERDAKSLVSSILKNLPATPTAGDEGSAAPDLPDPEAETQAAVEPSAAPGQPDPGAETAVEPSAAPDTAAPTSRGAGTADVRGTTSLIAAALATRGGDETVPAAGEGEGASGATASPERPEPTAEDAAALIEVYFELEEPDERDALLEELLGIDLPVVTAFLETMLSEDEDDALRAMAAAELARRRVPAGIEALEADLDDPEEPWYFENAVKTLCEVHGVGFYERLHAMWVDPECDGDKRRDVMVGMEMLDLDRAMRDFVALVEGTTDVEAMLDDQIEVAMMAFVRHDHKAALPALEGLRARIAAAGIDADERQELIELVQEGIDLLAGDP